MKILLLALVCASLAQSGMTMNSFNSPIPQDIITFITNFVKQIIIPLVENVKTLLPPAAQKIFANLVEDFRPAIAKLEQNVRPTTTENNNRMFANVFELGLKNYTLNIPGSTMYFLGRKSDADGSMKTENTLEVSFKIENH
uniref:Uncharacterized protein n=2 Tax=Cacopsylla melanoneura TaxID=428564 RepID=A0A8D8LXN4_9HEMI